MTSRLRLDSPEQYTVGWIAALPHELAAATAVLDEIHDKPFNFEQSQQDTNAYTWGRIGNHNVVIASLPSGEYGLTIAATTAISLRFSLPHIRFGLMVGIGAGVPQLEYGDDVRLGDVVVSQPQESSGGVIQYDLIKAKVGGHFLTGQLAMPPEALRKALAKLQAKHELEDSVMPSILQEMLSRFPRMAKKTLKNPGYVYQGAENDRLFAASSQHIGKMDCRDCRKSDEVLREQRDSTDPQVHYGIIASGNTLVKSVDEREEILKRMPMNVRRKCLCLEMEAAGLMNAFPCMVIRGICDYGDEHKNDQWQKYAAATAACFAKELLASVDAEEVKRAPDLRILLGDVLAMGTKTQSMVAASIERTRDQEVYKWLKPPDPSINDNKARDQRYLGTGHWFLEGEAFDSFKKGSVPFLWLYGIPGCGKTIMISSITRSLEQSSSDPPRVVLYFYFDSNDIISKQTLDGAVRSLLWQFSYHAGGSSQEVENLFGQCEDGRRQPPTQDLLSALDKALRGLGRVSLVLDALDECIVRPNLLSWLTKLAAAGLSNVQIIATSREEHDIKAALEKLVPSDARISMDHLAVDPDIRAYVRKRVRRDADLGRWQGEPEVQAAIETQLMEKASGMFRLAACQLDSITHCLSRAQLEQALSRLPRTLADVYARILNSIPEDYEQDLERLLQVLTWSEQPLQIMEAVDFLAVKLDGEPGFECKNRMPVPRDILRLCSSLVTIVPVRGYEEIRLSHLSVKEYLRSNQVHDKYRPCLTQSAAAVCIVSVSLIYLRHIRKWNWRLRPREFPLLNFAARSWFRFAQLANEKDNTLREWILEVLTDYDRSVLWLNAYDPQEPSRSRDYRRVRLPPPLYFASLGGLGLVADALIEKGADVHAKGGDYGDALQAACLGGHCHIVQKLLDHGAEINAKGGKYGNALQAACSAGHESVSKLLLRSGTNIHAQGGIYGNALQAACAGGYGTLAELLLDSGAAVNAGGGLYGNALQAACFHGSGDTADLLLDRGAEIDAPGSYSSNALHAACLRGFEKVVQVVLKHRADPNVRVGNGRTHLIEAAAAGELGVVKVLLEGGARADSRDNQGRTALHMATICGLSNVVKALLDAGATSTIEDAYGATALRTAIYLKNADVVEQLLRKELDLKKQVSGEPLLSHWAAETGQKTVVRMLLSSGLDINTTNTQGKTALHRAAERGHADVVSLLLDEGADSSVFDQAGRSALSYAIEKDHITAVELLIMSGANPETQDTTMPSILHWASQRGYDVVLGLVLDSGIRIDYVDNFQRTALHLAATEGQDAVVSLLLSRGTKVDQADKYGKTALHRAAEGGHEAVVFSLLKEHANPNCEDIYGETVLGEAIDRGHTNIAQLLLSHGAHVNAVDRFGMTALHRAVRASHTGLVRLLLERRADGGIEDINGNTALDQAWTMESEEIKALLLSY